jgi:epoxyqueuosine reductase
VVAGNLRAVACLPRLARLADPDAGLESPEGPPAPPLVRAHAVWALARLGEHIRLARLWPRETDPLVLAEYAEEGLGTGPDGA